MCMLHITIRHPCCFRRFVVGQPIEAPKLEREGEPSQAEVDATHARFYAAVEQLWATHADTFPGYQGVKLRLVR